MATYSGCDVEARGCAEVTAGHDKSLGWYKNVIERFRDLSFTKLRLSAACIRFIPRTKILQMEEPKYSLNDLDDDPSIEHLPAYWVSPRADHVKSLDTP